MENARRVFRHDHRSNLNRIIGQDKEAYEQKSRRAHRMTSRRPEPREIVESWLRVLESLSPAQETLRDIICVELVVILKAWQKEMLLDISGITETVQESFADETPTTKEE